jgi:hypothetical protein
MAGPRLDAMSVSTGIAGPIQIKPIVRSKD